MASKYGDNVPLFNTIEEELVYWKARSNYYESVFSQYQGRCIKSQKCAISDDDQEIKDPVKKARLVIDPFNVFPPHIYELILHHVNNSSDDMDLYRLSQISSGWNEAIQNYKPTAEKIEKMLHLYVDDRAQDLSRVLSFWLKTNFEVKYKTATIPFNKFGYNCLMKFSSTLENVFMTSSDSKDDEKIVFDSNPKEYSVFVKLQKLSIGGNNRILDQLVKCTFPVLKKLEMPMLDIKSNDEVRSISNFFSKMSTIEQLCMMDLKFLFKNFDDNMLEAPFRLKSLCLHEFMRNFIQLHADTLENLAIKKFKDHKQIEFIIKNMKKLKFLSLGYSQEQMNYDLGYAYDSDDDDEDNDCDKSFVDYSNVIDKSDEEHDEEDYGDYYAEKNKEVIQKAVINFKNETITTLFIAINFDEFIKYIPSLLSLESLIFHDELELQHIKFIALNAQKLKRIICVRTQPKLRELYAAFSSNREGDNRMINKNIEIIRNTSTLFTVNPNRTFC